VVARPAAGPGERAFNDGALLRTHLLRPTWHFVAPADIRWLLALTAPRVHGLNGTFYRRFGIDDEAVRRLHRALVQALQGATAHGAGASNAISILDSQP
jgi:hypothetical protein